MHAEVACCSWNSGRDSSVGTISDAWGLDDGLSWWICGATPMNVGGGTGSGRGRLLTRTWPPLFLGGGSGILATRATTTALRKAAKRVALDPAIVGRFES